MKDRMNTRSELCRGKGAREESRGIIPGGGRPGAWELDRGGRKPEGKGRRGGGAGGKTPGGAPGPGNC